LESPELSFAATFVEGFAALVGLALTQADTPFDQAIGWKATLWLNGEAKQAVTEDLVIQS